VNAQWESRKREQQGNRTMKYTINGRIPVPPPEPNFKYNEYFKPRLTREGKSACSDISAK